MSNIVNRFPDKKLKDEFSKSTNEKKL